jgi:tryptophanyl-tRNA synthetase
MYGEVFPEPEALISDFPRLMGLDGENKMSKSLNNAIYLSDSKEEVSKKSEKAEKSTDTKDFKKVKADTVAKKEPEFTPEKESAPRKSLFKKIFSKKESAELEDLEKEEAQVRRPMVYTSIHIKLEEDNQN